MRVRNRVYTSCGKTLNQAIHLYKYMECLYIDIYRLRRITQTDWKHMGGSEHDLHFLLSCGQLSPRFRCGGYPTVFKNP